MVPRSKPITRIVCMGDSITEGFGLGQNDALFYPSTLNEYLGHAYEVSNKGVTCSCVINTELDGSPVGLPYVLQPRFQEALDLKGDIYVVMLGTNDASDGMNPDTGTKDPHGDLFSHLKLFASCYSVILDSIKKSAPEAKVFVVTPIPILNCIWPKHQERYLEKVLPIIKKVAKENKLCLIDLHKEFLMMPSEQLEQMYQPDGLHPNIIGAQVIASIIAGYIKAKA